MSCTLVIEDGQPPILQTVLVNKITGLPIIDAVVRVTIKSKAGVLVVGETWPVTMPYAGTPPGAYRAQFDGIDLDPAVQYVAEIEVTPASGPVRSFAYNIVVTKPGCGNAAPATSPASPAYCGPTIQTRLNEAQTALHMLQMGQSARVIVDQNGERVEFTAANRTSLQAYVQDLQRQLGQGSTNYRPISVCM